MRIVDKVREAKGGRERGRDMTGGPANKGNTKVKTKTVPYLKCDNLVQEFTWCHVESKVEGLQRRKDQQETKPKPPHDKSKGQRHQNQASVFVPVLSQDMTN